MKRPSGIAIFPDDGCSCNLCCLIRERYISAPWKSLPIAREPAQPLPIDRTMPTIPDSWAPCCQYNCHGNCARVKMEPIEDEV